MMMIKTVVFSGSMIKTVVFSGSMMRTVVFFLEAVRVHCLYWRLLYPSRLSSWGPSYQSYLLHLHEQS